eukprot:TRINITY_DN48052_c0_g1_i1.p1 TRINITY_DN48052_c0_g1~~TRINITY_DN48052_c0_g1_i1.p1  ORF type:complete len:123 (+),score=20.05 TRINITY_DN48052_c0_g1_i1:28-369(+)
MAARSRICRTATAALPAARHARVCVVGGGAAGFYSAIACAEAAAAAEQRRRPLRNASAADGATCLCSRLPRKCCTRCASLAEDAATSHTAILGENLLAITPSILQRAIRADPG